VRWRQQADPLVRTLGATTATGAVLGLLIGGIGGRLAMSLLVLTSGDGVRGVESDDGFVIGQFTLATLNLLVTGTLFGVGGAFVYLAVRPFMLGPHWARILTCGVASGAVLGTVLVNPDGVDFTVLSPVELAAALFIAIPAVFAVLVALTMEHVLQPGGWAEVVPLKLAVAPLAVFLFPPLLLIVGLPLLVVLGIRWSAQHWSHVGAVLYSPGAVWAARFAWGGVAAFGLYALTDDLILLQ
jgi:hypothetical protein